MIRHQRHIVGGTRRTGDRFGQGTSDVMRSFLSSALIACIFIFAQMAQAQPRPGTTYMVQPGSSLWFEGSSTINTFTCKNRKVNGFGEIDSISRTAPCQIDLVNTFFYTQVRCMSCGLAPMDHDMYKALKASEYPEIHYVLESVRPLPDTGITDSSFYVETQGKLTVSGKTNVIDMSVKVTRLGSGRFLLEGSKRLSMHAYGIEPPTALWGLIKANDRLTVHFRLIAAPESRNVAGRGRDEALAHGTPGAADQSACGEH